MATYAFGDVHGYRRTLCALLAKLGLVSGDRLIFVGDYVDRGPDSTGVIDEIIGLERSGYDVVKLRGNHDEWFIDWLGMADECPDSKMLKRDETISLALPDNGFAATAASYGPNGGSTATVTRALTLARLFEATSV